MAKEVGNIIRDNGAVPATIALLNGRVHIGKHSDPNYTNIWAG